MNSKIFKNVKNEKGQAVLLISLIVMGMLLFSGLFLSATVLKQVRVSENTRKFTQAYFLADAGVEAVLCEIKNGNIDLSSFNAGDSLLTGDISGVGSFEAVLSNDSPLIVKVTGKCSNTARAIEIAW